MFNENQTIVFIKGGILLTGTVQKKLESTTYVVETEDGVLNTVKLDSIAQVTSLKAQGAVFDLNLRTQDKKFEGCF